MIRRVGAHNFEQQKVWWRTEREREGGREGGGVKLIKVD